MKKLISRSGNELIRRRFDDLSTLKPAVYASLVEYLEQEHLISTTQYIERMGTGTGDMIRQC